MNDNVINNWDEIPEWKNREITNFANIFFQIQYKRTAFR